ncbi:MAG: type II toxin-antitoxin system CcdA family antitoxin [Acidimicrobiales bacterium]
MPKSRITVTIDEELLNQARSLGVNLSAASERGIADITETALSRSELARQVADYDHNGGVYDERKLARAKRVLADADDVLAAERRAG